VSDKIPKLSFEELPASIATALSAKVQRLGYLGEFFARTAHQEAALKAFMDFTDAAKGALDMRIVELVALTVAQMKDVPYERHQHERLAVTLGYGEDWVRAVERLEPERAGLRDDERVVQRYLITALERDGHGASGQLDAVVDAIGHHGAIAVMMVMARYLGHAVMVNSMGIGAPVPSIFEPGSNRSPSV
jgi:hypothetical protein